MKTTVRIGQFFFVFHNLTKEYPLNIILSIKRRILLTFTEKKDDFYGITDAEIDAVTAALLIEFK